MFYLILYIILTNFLVQRPQYTLQGYQNLYFWLYSCANIHVDLFKEELWMWLPLKYISHNDFIFKIGISFYKILISRAVHT